MNEREQAKRIMASFSPRKRFVLWCTRCDEKLGEDLSGYAETTNQQLLQNQGVRHERKSKCKVKLIRKTHFNGD